MDRAFLLLGFALGIGLFSAMLCAPFRCLYTPPRGYQTAQIPLASRNRRAAPPPHPRPVRQSRSEESAVLTSLDADIARGVGRTPTSRRPLYVGVLSRGDARATDAAAQTWTMHAQYVVFFRHDDDASRARSADSGRALPTRRRVVRLRSA